MKLIIKSEVDGSLMKSGIRLVYQKMPHHLQFGFHLIGVKRLLADFQKAVVKRAGTDKMSVCHFPGSVKILGIRLYMTADFLHQGIGGLFIPRGSLQLCYFT